MSTRYTSLLKINLIHPYFVDNLCPVVRVIPTVATQSTLNRLMIRLVVRNTGIELFSGAVDDGQPSSLESVDEKEQVFLTFILRPTDPTFVNYTDMPVAPASGQITVLDNLENNHLVLDARVTRPIETNNDETRPGDLALLTIYLNPEVSTGEDVTVHFTNRATHWRYFLIESEATDNRLSITDQDDNEVAFQLAAQNWQLPNGDTAIVLVSANPILLRQNYPTNFKLELVKIIDGREVVSSIILPNAGNDRINRDQSISVEGDENEVYFSDIYVYL